MKKQDRNWVMPPNSITKKSKATIKKKNSKSKISSKPVPTTISYWVDKNGEAQLYTPEQLAKCNILMNMNQLLNKSFTLIESIQKMDKDATIGTLMQQDYAQLKKYDTSIYGSFVKLMAATSDITFGEFLNFISQGDDSIAFSKIGKEKLTQVIKETNPEVVNFYKSDKLKKS